MVDRGFSKVDNPSSMTAQDWTNWLNNQGDPAILLDNLFARVNDDPTMSQSDKQMFAMFGAILQDMIDNKVIKLRGPQL